MSAQHIRFPPDSTGKRVGHLAYINIDFTGGTIPFSVGDLVTTPTTLVTGTVTTISGTTSTGFIHVLLNPTSPAAVNVGEALQVNSITKALSVGVGTVIYVQQSSIVGANNPLFGLQVDNQGAASVRFSEGSPQFDAFGKLQVSQSTALGDYMLRYDGQNDQFQDVVVGTGSIVHSQLFSGITLTTGTATGDSISRTSHEYHTYSPGLSQLIEMTVAVGDTGKLGVVRTWGYGDGENGVFFRVSGTTLSVVNRSSSTGAVIDEVINQANWNGDRLNGGGGVANISDFLLDTSKDNMYWIDLQWLGAGRVRFGVVIDGVRITCHSDQNANNQPFSYMSTASLPIHVSQFNTGIVASTSQLKFFCSTVKTEGTFSPLKRINAYTTPTLIPVTSNILPVTVLALRPSETFLTIHNRCSTFVQTLEIYNAGPDPVVFEVIRNAVEASATWVIVDPSSPTEVSTNAVTSGGRQLRAKVIPANQSITVDFESFKNGRLGLRRNAVASSGYSAHYYRVRTLDAAKVGSVMLTVCWEDVIK